MIKSNSLWKIIFFLLVTSLATSSVRADDKAKLTATYKLFDAMDLPTNWGKTLAKILDVQLKANPRIAPFKKVMLEFYTKHVGWNSIKESMAKVYYTKFTIDEINKLTEFYQTPIGRKSARLLPELSAEGAAVGQRIMQQKVHILRKMIAEEVARIKAKK